MTAQADQIVTESKIVLSKATLLLAVLSIAIYLIYRR